MSIPATTLAALALSVKTKLDARGGIRVVGDERLTVHTVGLLPATTAIQAALTMLPNVDVIIAGEVREWESVEYVRDHVTAGEKKALITIGRVLSEEPGMNLCARWLQAIVPEVRTTLDRHWRSVLEAGLMRALTAGDVVNRIKANLGVPWRETTSRDTFKSGAAETPVTGIATTMFCSFGAVQRAVAAGLNMIVPHEDTFWNDRDDISVVKDDTVYKAKVDFMTSHQRGHLPHARSHARAAPGLHVCRGRPRAWSREPVRNRAAVASLHHSGNHPRRTRLSFSKAAWREGPQSGRRSARQE